jgi:GWxTD domain-containing protein
MKCGVVHNRWRAGALTVLLFGGAVGASPRQQAQPENGVRVANARFWRSDATTLLEGTIGVPITRQGSSPTVELIVRDNAGNVLHEESWKQDVSPELARIAARPGGAQVTSSFSVALQKGAYSVVVRTADGSTVDSTRIELQSFAEQPLVSDIVLSPTIRVLGPADTAAAGELQRSVYAIARAPVVKLTPSQASLWYYVEAYAPDGAAADSASLIFSVTSADGGRTFLTSTRQFVLSAPGRPDAGKLDMTGLPPGEYRLVVNARAGGREATREARFAMGSLEEEPTLAVSPSITRIENAEDAITDRYFAAGMMPDSMIVKLVESLTLAPIGEPVSSQMSKMDPEAQRRFLARYWARLDPTPGTPRNELLEEYQKRVEFANRNYSERDIGRSGVRTDRGRIYVKYGPPDDRLDRPMTRKGAIDVWRYTRQRNLKFVFLDETGFEHFNLIMTNAPNERTQPNWQDRIGDIEIIRLVESF